MSLTEGTRLGAYEITGQIGAGGMGEVYRATDSKLGRDVAIKTLPAALASDKGRLARFEREAKLLAALNHPHIASVYSLDEHEGIAYIAMELVEGETLEARLASGALPLDEALQLGLQIAQALEAAHEKGVMHRDLKPANIMVASNDVVKVLDFGLAKAFAADSGQAISPNSPTLSMAMTQQGLILGTAGYMSPEQASGQATDQRADIWAFGVVLYEMLTGLPVFGGESVPHILAAVLQNEPDWERLPTNLHPRLKLMLERCLTKRPRDRYHSIADARVDIQQVLSDPRGVTPEPGVTTTAVGSSNTLRLAGAAAVAAIVAGVAGWLLHMLAESEPVPDPIVRFHYDLPEDQGLRSIGRTVMALSPDGSRFVLNTNQGLYVREMDELAARLIPGTEEGLTGPVFSPDSQSVAYFSDGALRRIAIGGGAPVVIASAISDPNGVSWEADGTILFGQPQGIYRVSASSGTPELIIPAETDEVFDAPRSIPGGDRVLLTIQAAGSTGWDEAEIVVVDVATRERTVVVEGGADARYLPSGHIVYALGDDLFARSFDASTLTVSGSPVPLVQALLRAPGVNPLANSAANYAVADDGTLVYVSGSPTPTNSGGSSLVWVDREGHETPIALEPCACSNPSLSPDGRQVALDRTEGENSEQQDIWIWSLEQEIFRRLTLEPGNQVAPLWSPDGERVAYLTVGDGLYWQPASGTGRAERIVETRGFLAAPMGFTDDGTLIYVEGNLDALDILTVGSGGDDTRQELLATDFMENSPALSPDGRWLAYTSNETGTFEVFVRPYPDIEADKQQISSGGGIEPTWARDGSRLYFLGPTHLMETAVETEPTLTWSAPEAIVARAGFSYLAFLAHNYDVAPDGERFLFFKQIETDSRDEDEESVRVIVVQNWLQELERLAPAH